MAPSGSIAIGTAASGGVGAGVKEGLGALKSSAVLLMILGGFHWVLRSLVYKSYDHPVVQIGTIVLFCLAGYALAARYEKAKIVIFYPMTLFFLWVFVFNNRSDTKFLIWFGTVAVILFLIFGLLTKKNDGFKIEALGLIPGLVLFLDAGLLAWFVNWIGITPPAAIENIILWFPWWFFLGLVTLPVDSLKSRTGAAIINILRIAGIIYVVILVIGTPLFADAAITDQENANALLTDFQEKQRAFEAEASRSFSTSPIALAFGCLTEVTDFDGCQERKVQEAEEKYICEELEQLERGTDAYDECIVEVQRQRSESTFQVSGVVDDTFNQATEARFSVSEFFPEETFYSPGQVSILRYPIEFTFVNPRESTVQASFDCVFNQNSDNVTGTITPAEATFTGKQGELTVTCVPDEPLNGTYNLVTSVTLHDLKTTARLTRAYIGEKSASWKEQWLPQLRATHFSGGKHLSQAPNDLVTINIGFGSPLENPFISGTEGLVLASTVTNKGRGDLLAITSYRIDFPGQVDDPACLEGTFAVPQQVLAQRTIHLPSCFVTSLPADLANPSEFVIKELRAELIYDYTLDYSTRVAVQQVGGTQP